MDVAVQQQRVGIYNNLLYPLFTPAGISRCYAYTYINDLPIPLNVLRPFLGLPTSVPTFY